MSDAQNMDRKIDTSSRHSIEIQSTARNPSEPAAGVIENDATDVTCRYFFHEGAYWTAVIPLGCVAEVFGQAFNFSKPKTRKGEKGPEVVYRTDGMPRRRIPILNHVQSRFMLQPGSFVKLFPNDATDLDGQPVHQLNDFVYTIEAVGPVGVRFNFKDAMAGTLVSAHRFLSTQQMVFERIVVENQYVTESPPLKLTTDEKQLLLRKSLLRSHQAGMTERYFLYRCCGTNNCTSSPFQILDKTVNYTFLEWIGSFIYRLPIHPRFYLRVRGLDADPGVRKFVRDEFGDYIKATETQKRKREYVRTQVRAMRAARSKNETKSESEA